MACRITCILFLSFFFIISCSTTENRVRDVENRIRDVEKEAEKIMENIAMDMDFITETFCRNKGFPQHDASITLGRNGMIIKNTDFHVNGNIYLCGDDALVTIKGTLQVQRIYLIGKRVRVQAEQFILSAPISRSVFVVEGSDAMIITADQLTDPAVLQAWQEKSPRRYGVNNIKMRRKFVHFNR